MEIIPRLAVFQFFLLYMAEKVPMIHGTRVWRWPLAHKVDWMVKSIVNQQPFPQLSLPSSDPFNPMVP